MVAIRPVINLVRIYWILRPFRLVHDMESRMRLLYPMEILRYILVLAPRRLMYRLRQTTRPELLYRLLVDGLRTPDELSIL